MFMEIFIKEAGHTVSIASNGREVLSMLDCDRFDLVIMDISMPVMDGMEATKRIREREASRGGNIPIVAMTAHALKGDRERFLAAGMNEYIPKPADMDTVLASLARVTAAEQGGRTSVRGTADASGELLDCQWIVRQYDSKRAAWRKLVTLYLAELPKRLGELRQAQVRSDWDALALTAHSLKGASGVVGAAGVAARAASIEQAARAADATRIKGLLDELEKTMDDTTGALPGILA